ncbi:hypothetical protein OLX02_18650 [Novosphingobium sp. KCTC 2891]|uniref:hypothetical protein n=1 Tax=Novosphingobium sp. KCTC 2891 TaxID=2989730 RepID=UPI0022232FDD|nr:hypothetical protein [Novosphingobium sp. KCTC 2891]MCW1384841.1 hypothetical protein [Novosphingobium sp. KCTC 2891]
MPRTRSRRETLTVSSLAIATVLASGAVVAHAQSFQGTGTVVAGSASVFATGTTTDVTVNSASAVIDWAPFDTTGTGTVAFQPNGTTATFTNNIDTTPNFAVLNRIIPTDPTRPISFDGQVISRIQSVTGGGVPGGTVFFYSPGGILVGPNARFDVGNLGLTTSDLPYDAQTGAFSNNGIFQFQQSQTGASIQIDPAAQITASNGSASNAYVAMVAPRIVNEGAITVDGSAALVAADAATIEFSPSGLFNIAVTSGSSATGTVLDQRGTISGAAGAAATTIHRIYMVAVPKNTAITMAIANNASLGFDPAAAADVQGNTIVLSAGYDVAGGTIGTARSAGGGTAATTLQIGAMTGTSAVIGKATGNAALTVANGSTATFESDVNLAGTADPATPGSDAALISVGTGANLTVKRSLTLTSLDAGAVNVTGVSDSSSASMDVDGGTVAVTGDLSVIADRDGLGDGGSATGGAARLTAQNAADVSVGGAINIYAGGFGAGAISAPAVGNGTGGTARLSYGSGSSVAAGSIALAADGRGGFISSTGYRGGDGAGGTATIEGLTGGGTLTVGGSVALSADGDGTFGDSCVNCTVEGGLGSGGLALFSLSGTALHTVTIGNGLNLSASASGGSAFTTKAGDASAGTARITAGGGAHVLTVTGQTTLYARGRGGEAYGTFSSANGDGGTAEIIADGAALTFGTVLVNANGEGGFNSSGGQGGIGSGGTARFVVETGGGSLTAADLTVNAQGYGGGLGEGFSGSGALGHGGFALVDAFAGSISIGSVSVDATGQGGAGYDLGGNGIGGSAAVRALGGTVTINGGSVEATGLGGFGIISGSGTGGAAEVSASNSSVSVASTFLLIARGEGGGANGVGNVGGTGTGGFATVSARNGTVSFSGLFGANAGGLGGSGFSGGGIGGDGYGGQVRFDAISNAGGPSTLSFNTAVINAKGDGGDGAVGASSIITGPGERGGAGHGGSVVINAGVSNGTLTASSLSVLADGTGGRGGAGGFSPNGMGGDGATGGSGFGGDVTLDTDGALVGVTPTGSMSLGYVSISANGLGQQGGFAGSGVTPGSAGAGGDGAGGSVTIRADRGGSKIEITDSASLTALGYGANGLGCTACLADAGQGTGGTVAILADGTTTGNTLKLLAGLTLDVSGLGGAALTTAGGAGIAGNAKIVAGSGLAMTTNDVYLKAVGFGGTAQGAFAGGAATGGLATIEMRTGSRLDVTGTITLDGSAVGGDSTGAGGIGGLGAAGTATLLSLGGTITSTGNATIFANGFGGVGDQAFGLGVGGEGRGGLATIAAGNDVGLGNGGSIALGGSATVSAEGQGRSGGIGGLGTGGHAAIATRYGQVSASSADVDAAGYGGNGLAGGTGGAGVGGVAEVISLNAVEGMGTITLGSASVLASGQGGAGGTGAISAVGAGVGGTGGAGTGGMARAIGSAGNGRIVLGDLAIGSQGLGGVGGTGAANDGGVGADGGIGGAATGGVLDVGTQSGADTGAINLGSASFGTVSALARGFGGGGGAGGAGATASGNGGAGGMAVGGRAVLLVRGSPVTLSGPGSFVADAIGGAGGAGATQGVGGDAVIGRDPGGAALVASSRFLVDNQRGSLNAGVLSFQAVAQGGAGSTTGAAINEGLPIALNLRNADIAATSMSFFAAGQQATGAAPAEILIQGGSATLSGGLSFTAPGDLVVSLDGGDLVADHVQIGAANWVAGTPAVTPGTIHGTNGVFLATAQDLITDANLQSDVGLAVGATGIVRLGNLRAGTDLDVEALGSASVGSVDAGGLATLKSGGALLVNGPIHALDTVRLHSDATVSAGNIVIDPSSNPAAVRDAVVLAGGAISLGDITAANTRLFGAQAISAGAISSGDVAVLGGGGVLLGSVAATGRVLVADISMASLGGDPSISGYDMGALFAAPPVRAAGAIAIGNTVSALSFTGATAQSFSAGGLSATNGIVLDAGGAISVGPVTAGTDISVTSDDAVLGMTFAAGGNLSIFALGDVITAGRLPGGGFGPALDLTAGGSATIRSSTGMLRLGAVTASGGLVSLDAGTDVTVGALTGQGGIAVHSLNGAISLASASAAAGAVDLAASADIVSGVLSAQSYVNAVSTGGGLQLADITAGGSVTAVAPGAITLGAIDAGRGVALSAGTTLGVGGAIHAFDAVSLQSGGTLGAGDIVIGASSDPNAVRALSVLAGGAISLGNLAAAQARLFGTQAISAGVISVDDLAVLGGGDMSLGSIGAGGRVLLAGYAMAGIGGAPSGSTYDFNALFAAAPVRAAGAITIGGTTSAGSLVAATAQGFAAGPIAVGTSFTLDAGGAVTLGPVLTGTDLAITGDDAVLTGALTAGGDLSITAQGGIATTNLPITAGGGSGAPQNVLGGGSVTLRSIGGGLLLGAVTAQNGALALDAAGDVGTASLAAHDGVSVRSTGGSVVIAGGTSATAGSIDLTANGNLSTGLLSAVGSIAAQSAAGSLQVGAVGASGGAIDLGAATDLTAGALSATGDIAARARNGVLQVDRATTTGGAISLTAGGDLGAGALSAPGDVSVRSAGGGLILADVTSAGAIDLGAAHAISAGALTAATTIAAQTAGGALQLGSAATSFGGVTLLSSGDLTAGTISAGGSVAARSSAGALHLSDIDTSGSIDLGAAGAIGAGALHASINIAVASQGGPVLVGPASASGGISLAAAGDVSADTLLGGDVSVFSSGGALNLAGINAGGTIALGAATGIAAGGLLGDAGVSASSGGAMTLGPVASPNGDITLDAGGTLVTGSLFAAGRIGLSAAGAATTDAILAGGAITGTIGGDANLAALSSRTAGIAMRSGGTLAAGFVEAATDIALVATRDLSLGPVIGRDMALLAGGNVVASSITSGSIDPQTGAIVPGSGRILLADASMASLGGQLGTFNFDALFAAAPARVSGAIRVGHASGGRFAAAAAGDVTVGALDASQDIRIDSGGTVTVDARWNAPSISIASNDIAIRTQSLDGEALGLNAGVSGSILLQSLNRQQVLIGDGLAGQGYALGNGEWALIRSGSLTIRALDNAGTGADVLIGNLDVTGPQAGSTIDDPNGVVRFETVGAGGNLTGGIRIVGNVAARGFLATNALSFGTGLFELDAATGSLSVRGSGTAPAGILRIEAGGIHVASGTILDKLRANPFYTGLESDLDGPAAVQRPDGVLTAGGFDFTIGRTFYVQNTGTALAPAGFLTAADAFRVVPGSTLPLVMIVNGRFSSGSTVLSGTDAVDAFKANHAQIGFFSADSRLNGCLISAASCLVITETPDPAISSQITLLNGGGLGDTPGFGSGGGSGGGDGPDEGDNGDGQQQGEGGDGGASPIAPPTPLIDMRPLNPPGKIEEPVAGSGNPALMGSAGNGNSAQGGEQ